MKTAWMILILNLCTCWSLKATAMPDAQEPQAPQVLSGDLSVAEVIPLPDIKENLSGITYNFDTDTYFLILNDVGRIFEYDRSFSTPLRVIKMRHLKDKDTEDIVYLGQNRFAISSEKNYILIVTIEPGQTEIDMKISLPGVQLFTLPSPSAHNLGLEGVCFSKRRSDQGRGTFYTVQEKDPERVFSFEWPLSDKDFKFPGAFPFSELLQTENLLKPKMTDLSSCTFDETAGHLLILSQESSRVMEFSADGATPIATFDIPPAAPQYEGITLGPDREVILVSEPNWVVILKRNK